jgi:hypothetical protein
MAKNISRMGEYGSGATDQLRAVIEKHQQATERQTRWMICLTWVMTILTIAIAAPIIIDALETVRSWAFWQAVRVWFP